MSKKQQPPSNKERNVCANCGMTSDNWTEGGYKLGSQRYCCQGCAEQTGCTCTEGKKATA